MSAPLGSSARGPQTLTVRACLLLAFCTLTSVGCQHAMERKAIEGFVQAIETADLEAARDGASMRFNDQALRRGDALDDWSVLGLPEGELTVAEVIDVSDDEKQVKVEIGDHAKKMTFRLVREKGTKQWVVDDIYTKQRYEGVIAKKAVTEQMNLFLTVRDLLSDFGSGMPEKAASHLTSDLRAEVAALPPESLSRLLKRIVGERPIEARHKPEAQLDEHHAVVRLDRARGEMILSLKLEEGEWRLDDLAVESREDSEHIPSLRKLAVVMSIGSQFLSAYSSGTREDLAAVTTEKFYAHSLKAADLRSLTLPAALPDDGTKIRTFPHYAEIVVTGPEQVAKITLDRTDDEGDLTASAEYRVEEVTLYDLGSDQQILMSSYFNSQAIVTLFTDLLQKGDLATASKLCTPDFESDVWLALGSVPWQSTPLSALQNGRAQLHGMNFQGPLTLLDVTQGRYKLTYQLRSWNGQTLIDDIRVPNPITPDSLRETMKITLPVRRLELALRTGRLDDLRRACSLDFNRQVWSQTNHIPNLGLPYLHYLTAPVSDVRLAPEEAVVTLGTAHQGARVSLKLERETWLVDDVTLLAGVEASQQAGLKDAFRDRLVVRDGAFRHHAIAPAERTMLPGGSGLPRAMPVQQPQPMRPQGPIHPASATAPMSSPSRVRPAYGTGLPTTLSNGGYSASDPWKTPTAN